MTISFEPRFLRTLKKLDFCSEPAEAGKYPEHHNHVTLLVQIFTGEGKLCLLPRYVVLGLGLNFSFSESLQEAFSASSRCSIVVGLVSPEYKNIPG